MTRVIAGGCWLGPTDLRETLPEDAPAFWVPHFELTDADPSPFRVGDLIDIPPSVTRASCFVAAQLRVVARRWTYDSDGPALVWHLVLLCADADPDETARAYFQLPISGRVGMPCR